MNPTVNKLKRRAATVLLLGALFCRWTADGGELSTNAPVRWIPLSEVLKRWNDIPWDEVQREAERGDLTAQHYLGYCYGEGVRVPADGKKAVEWYERAGNGGYLPSFSNIGFLYQRGKGVPRDYEQMLHYYRLAAEAGYPGAQLNMGFVYRDGIGVRTNLLEAMRWFRRAADGGDVRAFSAVGRSYRFGQGVPRDVAEAKKWFQKAVDRGDSLGEMNLGLLYEEDENRAKEAIEFYRKAADQSDVEAMVKLYACYWDAKGVEADHALAMKWLNRAAETGDAYAEYLLGYRYQTPEWEGSGPNRKLSRPNYREAARWYRRSAEHGWLQAEYQFALLCLRGDGFEQDEEQGLEWLRKAADQNHAGALYKLAWLYSRDIGEPRNEADRPFNLLLRAAGRGSRESFWALSQRYQEGLGTSRDLVEAAAWRYRAASADMMQWGHNDAQIASAFDESKTNDAFASVLVLFGKAATHNDASAMRQIASMYEEGKNVPRDLARARFWSALAERRTPSGDVSPESAGNWNETINAARMILNNLGQR